jgi:hypothetical protein
MDPEIPTSAKMPSAMATRVGSGSVRPCLDDALCILLCPLLDKRLMITAVSMRRHRRMLLNAQRVLAVSFWHNLGMKAVVTVRPMTENISPMQPWRKPLVYISNFSFDPRGLPW